MAQLFSSIWVRRINKNKMVIGLLLGIAAHVSFCAQPPRMVPVESAVRVFSGKFNLNEEQQKIVASKLAEIADSAGKVDIDTAREVALSVQAIPTQAGPAATQAGEAEEKESASDGGEKGKLAKKTKSDRETERAARRALIAMNKQRGGEKLDPRSDLIKQLGKHVASFEPGIVMPWNIQFALGEVSQVIDGMQGRQMRASANGHYLALFTGYGEHMATGVRQALIEIWDMQLMQKVRDVAIATDRHDIAHWAISPAGNRLAFFTENSPAGTIFDVQRQAVVCTIQAKPFAIKFSQNGSRLAVQISKTRNATEWDTNILTYDSTTGQLLYMKQAADTLPATKDQRSIVFSDDETKLAIYHHPAPFIDVWDIATQNRLLQVHRNDDKKYGSVVLDYTGTKLAVYSIDIIAIEKRKNRYIEVWNTQTGEKIAHIRLTNAVNSIGLSPDGRILLTAALGSPITAWNVEELERQYRESEGKRRSE